MNLMIVMMSALLAGTPSTADATGTAGQTTSAPTSATSRPTQVPAANQSQQEERRICRRVDSETGSRMSSAQRVCMTAREWRSYDREQD